MTQSGFVLQMLPGGHPPYQANGQVIFKHNEGESMIQGHANKRFSLGVKIVSLPPDTVIEINPHEDLVHHGLHSAPQHFNSKDHIGKQMHGLIHNFNHIMKKLKKGDNIFRGILKKFVDDPLDLLALA